MKTANPQLLGVLGGMGPMATVDFLAKLIKATPASCDQDHIPIIAHFVPQIPDRSFHVEICNTVLRDIQKQLNLKTLDIKYSPVTSQNRIPLLQNGTVDIECGSTTNNATRQKDVAFAVTTYVEEIRIAVKANSGITSLNQLNGKKVATT